MNILTTSESKLFEYLYDSTFIVDKIDIHDLPSDLCMLKSEINDPIPIEDIVNGIYIQSDAECLTRERMCIDIVDYIEPIQYLKVKDLSDATIYIIRQVNETVKDPSLRIYRYYNFFCPRKNDSEYYSFNIYRVRKVDCYD